jgi:hypothetical protein
MAIRIVEEEIEEQAEKQRKQHGLRLLLVQTYDFLKENRLKGARDTLVIGNVLRALSLICRPHGDVMDSSIADVNLLRSLETSPSGM